MISDPREAIQLMIESTLGDVNTNMPATIVSYDAARNRAIVKPDLPKRLDSEQPLESPQIVEVPIVWPASGGGNASFTMPLKAGDGVMLSFQQRSLEGWLSGKKTMPDDPRQFDLSDCVAIAGCQPSGTVAHSDNVVLKFGKANVTLMPDGTIVFGNDQGNITIDGGGTMTLHAQTIKINTPANSFTLETHRHSQGSDAHGDAEAITDPPVPGSL
jgi:hypothetical protein